MTIEEFIEARIAEDELIAQSAIDPERPGTHWRWEDGERDPLQPGVEVEGLDTQAISLRTVEEYPTLVHPLPAFILRQVEARQQGGLWHIARHDPARVLRQCTALRALVGDLADNASGLDDQVDGEFRCADRDYATEPLIGDVMRRTIAAIWSDHPDYRQEWAA